MPEEVHFRPDLYAGSAEDYDRYRPGYPPELLARLVEEAGLSDLGSCTRHRSYRGPSSGAGLTSSRRIYAAAWLRWPTADRTAKNRVRS
jgi:hypothetical protein